MLLLRRLLAVVLLAPAPALACSLAGPSVLRVEPDADDGGPPARAVLQSVSIRRAPGPTTEAGRRVVSSCDDVGWITLELVQPPHDPHPPEDVGYLLELEEGAPPDGLVLPEVPWRGPTLVLPWLDVDPARRLPVDFVLRVTPVDVAARRGPSVLVPVVEPSEPTSCGTTKPLLVPCWLLVLLLRRSRAIV